MHNYELTKHARKRLQQRGISVEEVNLAIRYGRYVRARRADHYFVGNKEIRRSRSPALRDLNGLHIVVGDGNRVLTAYRNVKPHRWLPAKRRQTHGFPR